MTVTNTRSVFKNYRSAFNGLPGYIAGLPSYPRNFSRDVILAGILSMDEDMLETQIRISAAHQGVRDDPLTGEEPGKIHHELPGVTLKGRGHYLTTYNACDTTSLFLLAIEGLREVSNDKYQEIVSTYHRQILSAVAYLRNHLEDDLFYERPPKGASHFTLKVTYWKDSILPDVSGREELNCPAAYALPHFMAARALMGAASILDTEELTEIADKMFRRGISQFMQTSQFVIVKTHKLVFAQDSSDELHCLAYIPLQFKDRLPLEAMQMRATILETPAGFACTPKAVDDLIHDTYHGYVVWPHEQAFIYYGCQKFGLEDGMSIATRVVPYIGKGNERLEVFPSIKPLGNNQQLWSTAAGVYFSETSALRTDHWL
jgi:glycogen debranching enzyme